MGTVNVSDERGRDTEAKLLGLPCLVKVSRLHPDWIWREASSQSQTYWEKNMGSPYWGCGLVKPSCQASVRLWVKPPAPLRKTKSYRRITNEQVESRQWKVIWKIREKYWHIQNHGKAMGRELHFQISKNYPYNRKIRSVLHVVD